MVDLRPPQSLQKPLRSTLLGTTPDFAVATNLTLESGRFLSTADVSSHARVVVLDSDLAKTLFGDADPLGKQVFVQDTSATVIGVLQEQSALLSSLRIHICADHICAGYL